MYERIVSNDCLYRRLVVQVRLSHLWRRSS